MVWKLAPENIFRARLSKMSENALLEHGIKLLSSLISVPRRKTDHIRNHI